jgi:6-phosphogluconolactonase
VSGRAAAQREVFDGPDAFADGAAGLIADLVAAAIDARGRCTLALSGGTTPESVYRRLAAQPYASAVDWSRVVFLFGDERCVPPQDPRSNYRMVHQAWFGPAGIPEGNVLRIRGEDDPASEALRYEQQLAALLPDSGGPVIDVVLLGLGENGHTASLFPGTAALRERSRTVVAQYVEVVGGWRVTLTAPMLNNARDVLFLVQGRSKAQIVHDVINGPRQSDVWPAQLIAPVRGRLTWVLDRSAAALLEP